MSRNTGGFFLPKPGAKPKPRPLPKPQQNPEGNEEGKFVVKKEKNGLVREVKNESETAIENVSSSWLLNKDDIKQKTNAEDNVVGRSLDAKNRLKSDRRVVIYDSDEESKESRAEKVNATQKMETENDMLDVTDNGLIQKISQNESKYMQQLNEFCFKKEADDVENDKLLDPVELPFVPGNCTRIDRQNEVSKLFVENFERKFHYTDKYQIKSEQKFQDTYNDFIERPTQHGIFQNGLIFMQLPCELPKNNLQVENAKSSVFTNSLNDNEKKSSTDMMPIKNEDGTVTLEHSKDISSENIIQSAVTNPFQRAKIFAGKLGLIQVHKSGKVTLKINGIKFKIMPGVNSSFCEEICKIALQEQDGTSTVGKLTSLGQIKNRVICVPDMKDLLHKVKQDARTRSSQSHEEAQQTNFDNIDLEI